MGTKSLVADFLIKMVESGAREPEASIEVGDIPRAYWPSLAASWLAANRPAAKWVLVSLKPQHPMVIKFDLRPGREVLFSARSSR